MTLFYFDMLKELLCRNTFGSLYILKLNSGVDLMGMAEMLTTV